MLLRRVSQAKHGNFSNRKSCLCRFFSLSSKLEEIYYKGETVRRRLLILAGRPHLIKVAISRNWASHEQLIKNRLQLTLPLLLAGVVERPWDTDLLHSICRKRLFLWGGRVSKEMFFLSKYPLSVDSSIHLLSKRTREWNVDKYLRRLGHFEIWEFGESLEDQFVRTAQSLLILITKTLIIQK